MRRVALLTTLCSLPRLALAEYNELEVSTLEYADDSQRHRKARLLRSLSTERIAAPKLNALAKGPASLDPRPAIKQQTPLYQRLGLMGWSESISLGWPWLPGLYVPEGDRIVLSGRSKARATKAAHALSVRLAVLDQNQGLGTLTQAKNHDAELAREAFVLGDALLMWLSRANTPPEGQAARDSWAEKQIDGVLSPRGKGFPATLVRERFVSGLQGVLAVRDSSPWIVVDDLHSRGLPSSTFQLLHVKSLLADEPVRTIRSSKLAATEGRGEPREGTLGELRMRLWLDHWLDRSVAVRASKGWAGDRYALYAPTDPEQPWTSTLVLLTVWDTPRDDAEEYARDFQGALSQIAQARGLKKQGDGAYEDDRGLAHYMERREDKVLYIAGCKTEQVGELASQVWEGWKVDRPDLVRLAGVEEGPPPEITPMPPPVPWYRRTPGIVALTIWLLVVLPLLSYGGYRLGSLSPVRFYAYGLGGTLVLILVGWILGA